MKKRQNPLLISGLFFLISSTILLILVIVLAVDDTKNFSKIESFKHPTKDLQITIESSRRVPFLLGGERNIHLSLVSKEHSIPKTLININGGNQVDRPIRILTKSKRKAEHLVHMSQSGEWLEVHGDSRCLIHIEEKAELIHRSKHNPDAPYKEITHKLQEYEAKPLSWIPVPSQTTGGSKSLHFRFRLLTYSFLALIFLSLILFIFLQYKQRKSNLS